MSLETPLETVKRIWPGEWEEYPHQLRRVFVVDGRRRTLASIIYLSDDYYYAEPSTSLGFGDIPIIGGQALEPLVRDLRDMTQARVRLLADAAGVMT